MSVQDESKSWPSVFRRMFEEGLGLLRVDELHEPGKLVIRSELPGIDPDRDLDVSVSHGVLHIRVQHEEQTQGGQGSRLVSQLRSRSFVRDIPLPKGVKRQDITATVSDGVLEVVVPLPPESPDEAGKIAITRSDSSAGTGSPSAGTSSDSSPGTGAS